MKSRTYLWIARSIWRCENCHIFWMKSFASSKLCRVSLWARLLSFSWAGICNSNLFQILNRKLFAPSNSLQRNLSPPTESTQWRYWSSSRSSPLTSSPIWWYWSSSRSSPLTSSSTLNKAIIQETSWGGRGHNYTDWQPAYVLPAPPLDQPSCSHFFRLKI